MLLYLKTEEEIKGFKKAGSVAGRILHELLQNVKVGITTLDLDNMAREKCKECGGVPIFLGHEGFPAAICSSNNEVVVHGIPNAEKIKDGDVLGIDIGVEIDGFIGDTAETLVVGSGEIKNYLLVSSCREALKKAIKKAVPGNKLNDISEAIYKNAGRFKVVLSYGGHGMDRNNLHSKPFIPNIPDEYGNFTLRAGMVLAIEPMYVIGDATTSVGEDKWSVVVGGKSAHCEHTILVTDGEPIILTDRSKYE